MNQFKDRLFLFNPIYWPAWLGLGGFWLLAKLPYRFQITLGKSMGKLIYHCSRKLKHITETNIKLCFPQLTPKQQTELVKKNFASLGMGIVETAMAWWAPQEKLNLPLSVSGIEHLEKALAKKKGVVFISPHFHCLEIVGQLFSAKHSIAVMYTPHKKRFVAYLHEHFRKKPYVNYIARHKMRDVLRGLNNNIPIWYAYDIDEGKKKTVFAPFFGISCSTLTSASRIAKLSDAAIIPFGFFRSNDNFSYEVLMLPAVENFPSDDLVADATELNSALEQIIRYKPEQYIWQYKRFKTRPSGEKRFY